MAHHTLVGNEPHPSRPACTTRWYMTVDVAVHEAWWYWRVVDGNGRYATALSAGWSNEDQAKNDALNTLEGDWWE